MVDDVNYQPNWEGEKTQCQHCQSFQTQNGKNACVPPDKTFDQAITEYGEVSPSGHCNYFQAK